MFSENVYATYKYQQSSINSKQQSFQDKVTSVLNYEFVKTFDILKDVNSGTFANKLISVDLLARKSKTYSWCIPLEKASRYKQRFTKSKNISMPSIRTWNRFDYRGNSSHFTTARKIDTRIITTT